MTLCRRRSGSGWSADLLLVEGRCLSIRALARSPWLRSQIGQRDTDAEVVIAAAGDDLIDTPPLSVRFGYPLCVLQTDVRVRRTLRELRGL